MARGRKHTAEQVTNLLRQITVANANGKTTSAERWRIHFNTIRQHSSPS